MPLAGEVVGEDSVYLLVRTCQSNIHVAQVARTQAFLDGQHLEVHRQVIEEPGYIGQELKIDVKQGETLVLEKLASLYTSRDHAISECGLEARKAICASGPLRRGEGGSCAGLGAPVATLRRAYPARRSWISS